MEPTKALRDRLRKMVNDIIPKNGSVDDAAFSDEELNDILSETSNIYYAASELWTLKAGLLQGDIESYTAGNEKYDLTSLKDKLSFYLSMANKYQEQAGNTENVQGSIFLKFKTNDVI